MHFDTQDSPRPGLKGSHHLPPYSILCSSSPRLHPNGSFSRDSQVGVPKLSLVGVPGLWTFIAPRPELGLGRGLNQSCISHRELSNAVSHSLRRHRKEVDSRLLVVGSQTGSLTLDPSFAHNLGCRCPNGPCEAILGIYTSRSFHLYKEFTNARIFDPSNRLLNFRESRRTPFSHLWECELHSHTWPQSGVVTVDLENPQVRRTHPKNPFYLATNLCKPPTIKVTTIIRHNLPPECQQLHDPNK